MLEMNALANITSSNRKKVRSIFTSKTRHENKLDSATSSNLGPVEDILKKVGNNLSKGP